MSPPLAVNRRIVLARRPKGAPSAEDFRLESEPVPVPGPNQVLLRTRYLSLDPYMRGRMNEGRSYVAPVALGAPMTGQTVSVIEDSHNSAFKVGELVLANVGWQDYGLSDGRDLVRIDAAMPRPSYALGVLGMPGLTAYVGLLDIGQPKAGETVVVAAATGAVGSVVGQIARIKGARAVGIAGGKDKCDYVTGELGFDACVDHRAADFPEQLKAACPKGVDVYFENVGVPVFDAVLPLFNPFARVPVCGLIAQYNATELPPGPDRVPLLLRNVLTKRLTMRGFIVTDFAAKFPDFIRDMPQWVGQ